MRAFAPHASASWAQPARAGGDDAMMVVLYPSVLLAVVLMSYLPAAALAAPPSAPVFCDPHAHPTEYCPDGSACRQCGKPACACPPSASNGLSGVTLSQWNSSAGVLDPDATPTSQKVIPTLNFSVSTDGRPFSAEAVGTLVVPAGNYSFSLSSCTGVGLIAMVWIDGHLVARSAPAGTFLAGHDLGGSGKRSESVDDVLGFGAFPNAALGGGLDRFSGKYRKAVIVRVWHNPLNDSATGGIMCTKWVHNGDCSQQKPDPSDPSRVTIAVSFSHGATARETRLAPQQPFLPSMLMPELPPEHQKRLALQKDFRGWGSWIPDNILALTDYASGATITTMLCQVSTDTCLIVSQVESRNDHDPFGLSSDTRVGAHAWDGSYAQSFNSWVGDQSKPTVPNTNLNVSIEWSGGVATNGELHGKATLFDHVRSNAKRPTEATSWVDGYRDFGPGFCRNGQGQRPESFLCDSSSQGSGCPSFTASSCAALCSADIKCVGFMLQDMSQYQAPPTCNLVTSSRPSTAGRWVEQDAGQALEIRGVDGETRDHCYAKNGGPPGPPAPPTPSTGKYVDIGQGYCIDKKNHRPESWVCDGDGCPKATEETCRNLCSSDTICSGFMVQDMSIYGKPPTCNIVTTMKPSSHGGWSNENNGNGLSIDGHDSESRDHCWKKVGTPGPAPPGPAPPGPAPPGPAPPPGGHGDFVLVLQARFAWWRAGNVRAASDGTSLTLAPYGRPPITVNGFGEVVPRPKKLLGGMGYCSHANTSQACIAFALTPGQPVAFSTVMNASAASTAAAVAANREALYNSYAAYGKFAWAAEAVGAAVGWNFKFAPSELGPHLPVSPGWAGGHIGPYSDFQEGGSFGWDCTFASYLASLASKNMAYSALITIVKAKTSNGFVPNCATAGAKSQDRTEPNAGAKVLLEFYKKFGDLWMVELLFDDLLDTNNWAVRERTLAPLNLIALGTSTAQFALKPGSTTEYSCDSHDPNTGCMNAMQNSRYESGQDNSPMYDQPGVDSTTVINQNGEFMSDLNAPGSIEHGLVGAFVKMPLYDVGMSSLLVSEAQALADLAVVLGRNETAAMLAKRCQSMRALIQKHLWDDQLGIYSNKFSDNASFYPRISPTSFFPMFARSPTDAQTVRMMKEWLHSPTRFCVSPTGDMKGNNDMCYWGLPSISADDGAGVLKNDLGYWRGFVWGPLSILTYWSLQEYDHVPEVQHGRKMMVDQLSTMMARVWHSHRHICENFTPHKGKPGAHGGNDDSTDCTGGKFYHWGALPALELLIENGLYNLTSPNPSPPVPPPSPPPSPTPAPKPVDDSVTISIDAGAKGQPFNHVWKRSFGSGHAALGLRKDWQEQLARAANELGLRGVRQHGLLDDDIGIVVGYRQYNWTNVDILWDAIHAANATPIVELSFMPSLLANCSWDGDHDAGWIPGSHNITRPGAPKCSQSLFYGGVMMPPVVWADWYHLVRALVEHAVSRYGIEEVRDNWAFEVWNGGVILGERAELWGMSFPEPYMTLFNHSSRAVKDVDPLIKIGGPATMQLNYLNYFVQECENRNISFDFVSSHMYPNDGMCPGSSQPPVGSGGWNPDCFPSLVKNARQLLPPGKPLYLTEYSVGCCGESPEPNSAALIFRAVGSLHADVSVLSYWTFSMIFEENSEPAQELQGTFGLLSTHGVPKPGWEAFRLLHKWAGDTIVPTEMDPPWVDQGGVERSACQIAKYLGCFNNLAPEPACCHPMQAGCQGCGNSACQMSSYASSTLAAAIGKNNTPALCMELCAGAGWTVFGLNGNQCRCGNSNFKTPSKDHHGCTPLSTPGSCDVPCPGNLSATCGNGRHGWDIYQLECPLRATPPRVVAFATKKQSAPEDALSVFISHWHDAGPPPPPQQVTVNVTLPHSRNWANAAQLYRIDETHAHAVDAWHQMGSPAVPDVAQLQQLQTASMAVAEPVSVKLNSAHRNAVVAIDAMPPNAAYVVTFRSSA